MRGFTDIERRAFEEVRETENELTPLPEKLTLAALRLISLGRLRLRRIPQHIIIETTPSGRLGYALDTAARMGLACMGLL